MAESRSLVEDVNTSAKATGSHRGENCLCGGEKKGTKKRTYSNLWQQQDHLQTWEPEERPYREAESEPGTLGLKSGCSLDHEDDDED